MDKKEKLKKIDAIVMSICELQIEENPGSRDYENLLKLRQAFCIHRANVNRIKE